MAITIKNVKTFITAPGRCDLVVVKVETSEPGLYGLGCATFTQRARTVQTAIEEIAPLVVGRDVDRIEDTWQQLYGSSYWRNGPVLNNAISGIDEALWDIKGKLANMPVYDLLGGRCRNGAKTFGDAMGQTVEEVGDNVAKRLEEGYDHIRLFLGRPGDPTVQDHEKPENAPGGIYYSPRKYIHQMVELFTYIRDRFGDKPEFMIDVHERLSPAESITLATALEPFHLFFLEDSLSPENINWFPKLRAQTHTPLAMGELFNNVNEFRPLIASGDIDFIRCHISQLGGITPARKLSAFAELYGVKTAWHGPGDLSPIGLAAQVHLDLAIPNFGLQEHRNYDSLMFDMFPGAPEIRNTYLYVSGKPGLGVDFNEELAKKYPPKGYNSSGFLQRQTDGTAVRT